VGLIVLFFLAWELFCLMTGMSDLVLPRPSQVFATLIDKLPILWPHILQTLATTMIGFVLGVGLGVVLGAVIGVSKTAYDTAYPLLVGFSSIPKVAVVPIFVLWFGSGSVPAVLTALSICFFPIVVNIATGLATTEPELEILTPLNSGGNAAGAAEQHRGAGAERGAPSADLPRRELWVRCGRRIRRPPVWKSGGRGVGQLASAHVRCVPHLPAHGRPDAHVLLRVFELTFRRGC